MAQTMMLMKVYRYVKVGPTATGNDPAELDTPHRYERQLFDAIAFNLDGCSSPLGPNDEFEVYIEELK